MTRILRSDILNVRHCEDSASPLRLRQNGTEPFEMGSMWAMSQSFGFCCGYPIVGYNTGGQDPYAPGKAGGAAIAPQVLHVQHPETAKISSLAA